MASSLDVKGLSTSLEHSWAPLGRSWAALGRSWAPLGRVLGASSVLLGASWPPNALWGGFWRLPEAFGEYFRGSWDLFCIVFLMLAPLGHVLGSSWTLCVRSWSFCPDLGRVLAGFGFLERVSGSLGCFLAGPHAFNAAVADTLLHLQALFLLPFWCGGLCAAHGIHRTALRCPGVSEQYA